MIEILAMTVVVSTGAYFVALGAAGLLFPDMAKRFLLGFATSSHLHYLEMCIRLVVGGALIIQAPHMSFPALFNAFGWIVLLTTAVLLLVPWRWHSAFARQSVPRAMRFIGVIGSCSLALGGAILLAMLRGGGT